MCEYKSGQLAKNLQAKPFFRSHVETASDHTSYKSAESGGDSGGQSMSESPSMMQTSKKEKNSSHSQLSMPILRYVMDKWQNDQHGQMIVIGWVTAITTVSVWGIYQRYRTRAKLAQLRCENSGRNWQRTKQMGRSDNELDERLDRVLSEMDSNNNNNNDRSEEGQSTSETSSEFISSEEIHNYSNKKSSEHASDSRASLVSESGRIERLRRMREDDNHINDSISSENGAMRRILKLANTTSYYQSWSVFTHPFTMFSSAVVCLIWQVFKQSRMNDENGHLGELVVSKRWHKIPEATMNYSILCVEASLATAAASLCTKWLAQSLRINLSKNLQRKYGGHLIHVIPRVTEMQSRLTHDISQWSVLMASVMTGTIKPLISLGLCTNKLTHRIGWMNFLKCVTYSIVSGMWVRSFVSPNSTHSQLLAESEAMYYSSHARLIDYAEEIDLMKGISAEMYLLRDRLNKLNDEQTSESVQHFLYDAMQNYFVRYMGVLIAFITLLPMAADHDQEITEPTEFLLNSLHDLINLGLSLRDLALVFGKIRETKGLSIRINELNQALTEELEIAQNSILSKSNECISYFDSDLPGDCEDDFKDEEMDVDGDGSKTSHRLPMDGRGVEMMHAAMGKRKPMGKVLVSLINVTVYRPNTKNHSVLQSDNDNNVEQQLLIKNLNLNIIKGENLMIEGPNGCGKSSLIRAISGIWKYQGLIKFSDSMFECDLMSDSSVNNAHYDIMFVPQRSYLVPRLSIRDQLMYPFIQTGSFSSNASSSINNLRRSQSVSDSQIIEILNEFNLGSLILDKNGYLNMDDNLLLLNQSVSHVYWNQLSPGQQQCICLCRVLLRKPKIVFLDECCSAVSDSLTQLFYQKLRINNITAVSVTHDSSLLKYHSSILKFEQDLESGKVSHSIENREVIMFPS